MTNSFAPPDVFGDTVARACPLWDRASPAYALPVHDSAQTQRTLDEWRGLVAAGDQTQFARRLAWDGLTIDAAAALVSGDATDDPDVAWVDALRDTYGVTAESVQRAFANADDDGVLRPDNPLPFEELFVPLVEFARRRVEATAPVEVLSVDVRRSLERMLLARLTRLGLRTLPTRSPHNRMKTRCLHGFEMHSPRK